MTSSAQESRDSDSAHDLLFRRLSRSTFEEVNQHWISYLGSRRRIRDFSKTLLAFGWTHEEFEAEYSRRNMG